MLFSRMKNATILRTPMDLLSFFFIFRFLKMFSNLFSISKVTLCDYFILDATKLVKNVHFTLDKLVEEKKEWQNLRCRSYFHIRLPSIRSRIESKRVTYFQKQRLTLLLFEEIRSCKKDVHQRLNVRREDIGSE